MRFLFLTQYFYPEIGAPQTRLAAVCARLKQLGHDVEVVTALPNYPRGSIFPEYRRTLYRREPWNGIPIHRVWLYASVGAGFERLLNYLSFAFTSCFALARSKRPDFVFIESPPLSLSLPGIVAAWFWRASTILNVADLWPDTAVELGLLTNRWLLRAAGAVEAWAYSRATFVNALTEAMQRTLTEVKAVPARKVLFLPNGVDTHLFAPREPDSGLRRALGLEDKRIILYTGTQGYAHGLRHVIYAADLLRNHKDIHFLMLGDGSERVMLETLARELRLVNITFRDPIPQRELPAFFSIAACGLVSIRNVPILLGVRSAKMFPMMASGVPILYIGGGEGARIVQQASAGVVATPESPVSIAEAILRLLSNRELRHAFGVNGRSFVENHLDWSDIVDRWLTQLLERTGDQQVHAAHMETASSPVEKGKW